MDHYEQYLQTERELRGPGHDLRAFAETGDISHLDPKQCTPGFLEAANLRITDEGQLERIEQSEEESCAEWLSYLQEEGLDVSPEDVDDPEKVLAAIVPELETRNIGRSERITDIFDAIQFVSQSFADRYPEETVAALIEQVDFEGAKHFQKSRRVITFLEGLAQYNEDAADAINEHVFELIDYPEHNAFVNFLTRDLYLSSIGAAPREPEMPIVSIGKGMYAAFSWDGDRMFVKADEDGHIANIVAGRDAAIVEREHNIMLDSGNSIEEVIAPIARGLEMGEIDYDMLMFFLSERTQVHLQEVLGFSMTEELELHEVYYALKQLKDTTVADLDSLSTFSKKHGAVGFRTFLALNEDTSLGDTIIELGTELDQETNAQVFAKYAEIIDSSEQAAQEIAEAFKKGSIDGDTHEAFVDVAKRMRKRANDVLRGAHEHLKNGTTDELLEDLEDIHASSVRQSAIYASLVRNGELKPEHIGIEPTQTKGPDISERDAAEMRRQMERNYAKESEEFKQTILASFDTALKNPHATFHILRDNDGNIKAFSRIDEVYESPTDTKPSSLYFGSFNVEKMNTQGSGIGSYMLKETLQSAKEQADAEQVGIHAHCDPEAFITQKYIEWGFVAERSVQVAGKESFEITYHPSTFFETKDMEEDDLVQLAADHFPDGAPIMVFKTSLGATPDWAPLERGYVLARYFTNSEGERFSVFENAANRQDKATPDRLAA